MASHQVELLRQEVVAEGTMAFYFTKPPAFLHQAGQSILVTLVAPPETDGQGNSRTFTIASAPHEPELMVATRMRDTAFKRVLKSASPGTKIALDGPNGEMLLHADPTRPAALLAGGIGITPFLAMARHAARERLAHRLFLFYSNRRPEDAAFLAELKALETANPNYRLVATMTERGKSAQSWSGETGFIRREMLERYLPDLIVPIYYFAGPPAMTMAMQQMLEDCGLGDESMRYEEFYGY